MDILMIVGGLAALLLGGELLVGGAVMLARRLRVPALVVGLTVVGFGTSTPELVTSVMASLENAPGIAIGNVVGSNIANVLLVLGCVVLLRPVILGGGDLRRETLVLSAATLACVGLAWTERVGRVAGIVLVASLFGYLIRVYFVSRAGGATSPSPVQSLEESGFGGEGGSVRATLGVVAGLALTIVGGRFLVQGAIDLAIRLNASEAIIGLTLVAIGTSLPELVTSAIAARRGHDEVAFGNVVGSNIYNLLGILGVSAVVRPMSVPVEIARVDVWVMLAATAYLLIVGSTRRRVSRFEGALLLAAYGGYVGYLGSRLA